LIVAIENAVVGVLAGEVIRATAIVGLAKKGRLARMWPGAVGAGGRVFSMLDQGGEFGEGSGGRGRQQEVGKMCQRSEPKTSQGSTGSSPR
jgi:hypothetical protein